MSTGGPVQADRMQQVDAPGPSPWWLVRVDAYRFLIRREEVVDARSDLAPAAVAHLPAWVAGLVHVQGRLLAVLDLGRFLGVCTVSPGPLILPADAVQAAAWAIRVHSVEPGPLQAESLNVEVVGSASDLRGRRPLDARPRPSFAGTRWGWTTEQGQRVEADELQLSALLRHPRVREQA